MKYASIDIGTNTVLLMMAEVTDRIEEISDTAIITRLGEGLKRTGVLSKQAMERTLNALRRYRSMIDECSVDEILCAGTAALREAENRDDFLELVKNEVSLSIDVISEHDEAYYTYLSVRHGMSDSIDEMAIIDIGGGSTEVIHGTREHFIDFVSLPIGSVKLTEMFIKHDPPSEQEVKAVRDHITSNLKLPFKKPLKTVVGTAGTITTLGSIGIGLSVWDKKQIHQMVMNRARIKEIAHQLLAMKKDERASVPGIEKGREDIIPQGIILLHEIMKFLEAEELIIDANGVRHGMLCKKMAYTISKV